MARRSVKSYEENLRAMVEQRKGVFDAWLTPQLKAAAQCWAMTDKVFDELFKLTNFTEIVYGSTGQQKSQVNPLLPYYDKLNHTLIAHFEALGLNYGAQPVKVDGAKPSSGEAATDQMTEFLKRIAENGND